MARQRFDIRPAAKTGSTRCLSCSARLPGISAICRGRRPREIEQVLVPCGATLASICAPGAERAKNLRASQCREGWHLDTEPIPEAPAPDGEQQMWVEKRAPR